VAAAFSPLASASACAGSAAVAPSKEAIALISVSEAPAATYWVYVANEASDKVSRVRFGPGGLAVEKTIGVGFDPVDLDGAHGLSISADGRFWYLTTAHGFPWGRLWKYQTGTDVLVDSLQIGRFPATIGLTPDGSESFVVNFDLHGDPVPSSVSVIDNASMREIARIETCVKPHGSRVTPAGTFDYSVCVGDDQLVEISALLPRVTRRLRLTPGDERLLPLGEDGRVRTGEATAGSGAEGARCKPTWAEPSVDGRHVYVACNGHAEVLEIETGGLTVTRRFSTGKGPYNLDVSPDGRLLLATDKGAASVSVIELATGEELARIPTSRTLPHGIVVTPDSRYAFVANESVPGTRSTVDVLDLGTLRRVAQVQVEDQAGGIDFWKMEAAPEL